MHHYKKHKKRRSKDPTSFKVVCNAGGDILEFEGEITNGDPIMLICEFTIEDPEARAAKAKDAKDKLAALESGEWDGSEEQSDDETVVESPDILGDLLEDD